jgi:acetyl esterase/lipase
MMKTGYLGTENRPALESDPRTSPIHVAEKLPPSFLACGTADDLLEQTEMMATKL